MNFTKSQKIQFLGLTFSITWLCWGGIALLNQIGLLKYGQPLSMVAFIIGGNGVPIASYVLYKRWGIIKSPKEFFKLNFNSRIYFTGYLLTLSLLIMHFVILSLLVKTSRELPFYYGLIMFPVNLVGGGLEEIGWRGILQPFMEKKHGFTIGTFLVALIWTAWHIPLWFIEGTYQTSINFLFFAAFVVGLSYLLGLIRKSFNSVFLCILFHSFVNSYIGVLNPEFNSSIILLISLEVVLSVVVVKLQDNNLIMEG